MRALALSLACLGMAAGVSLGAMPVLAAAKKAAAKKAPVRKAPAGPAIDPQLEHATLYLKVLINGLQSDQVKDEAKTAMVMCLYDHSLGEVTKAADEVFAKAAGKVSRDKSGEVFVVLAGVCGYQGDPVQPATTSVPSGR